MSFLLPKLPWVESALAPLISAETISFHYTKHHAGYLNKLNELTKGTLWDKKPLEELVKMADGVMYNQAAQAWNHSFYWNCLSPDGGGEPKGYIKTLIDKEFNSVDEFRKKFSKAAIGHFGSGWVWLCFDKTKHGLVIHEAHDGGNPMRDSSSLVPLLTCDVWEHAYYIDYRNARSSYIDAWWNLVNWDFSNRKLEDMTSQ